MVRRALAVRVLAVREDLGVPRVVVRVRAAARASLAVRGLLLALGRRLLLSVRVEVLGLAMASGGGLLRPLLLGRVGLLAVRRLLRLLLTVRLLPRGLLGSAVVVPAASDPESSHVIERTWSRERWWAGRRNKHPLRLTCDIP